VIAGSRRLWIQPRALDGRTAVSIEHGGGKIHFARSGPVGATEPCLRVAVVRRWRCGCGLRERVRRRNRKG